MLVTVNGEQRAVPSRATVASVLAQLDLLPGARGVAVAVNGEVVARGQWESAGLRDGDGVEILAAVAGG
ncbi:MAG: sulfur carrier protein ThiS [Actinomycetota bacterium]|nr:sulfur carrier protein ThiS [Actinomycetota bacterium]